MNTPARYGPALSAMITVITAACFFPSSVLASPNGRFSELKKWKPEWTKEFVKCFNGKEGQGLNGEVSAGDSTAFCKQKVEPVDFWLAIFIPLAGKESGFNPKASGKNGGKTPQGLFQMNSADMKGHGCSGTDPMDVNQNICCAVKIAADQKKKNSFITQGKRGIMADFWQPMRSGSGGNGRGGKIDNTKNLEDIKKQAQSLCTTTPSKDGGGSSSPGNSGSKVQ